MPGHPCIYWFRNDLRLSDNEGLLHASKSGRPLVALYILDEETEGFRRLGGASRWWLHHALVSLQAALKRKNVPLILRRGKAEPVIRALVKELQPRGIAWGRRYGEAERHCDARIKTWLQKRNIEAFDCNTSLMVEPWDNLNKSGQPFKVFTPYWKAHRLHYEDMTPKQVPKLKGAAGQFKSDTLHDWHLLPTQPDWAGGFSKWKPGEKGAQATLQGFIDKGLKGYATLRDRPGMENTSRLSPYLHFGEISPRQACYAVRAAFESGDTDALQKDVDTFCKEVGWREFSYALLYYFPDLATKNFQARFDAFTWQSSDESFRRWQKGETGYPIVDAGMRQMWQTGWMHNRVRMIVASFLIKHLLIDWRMGENWFWDTLVDADSANNAASWQWVAGSGADASPYFRVFNPVLQGLKFDKSGDYVRRFVPEISKLPDKYIHQPWQAPDEVLKPAGVKLGATYPMPIVDHAASRARALKAYKKTRKT